MATKQPLKPVKPVPKPAPIKAARPGRIVRPSRFNADILRVFRDTYGELKKVTWPSRDETTNLTSIVVVFSVAMGLALGLIDLGFYSIINAVFVGGG